MLEFCRDLLGRTSRPSKGAAFFRQGERWPHGAQVSWGHSDSRVMLDFQGGLLARISGEDGMKLLRAIWNRAWKITRIDGALDFIGQGKSIVDNARASCMAEELCLMRSFGERFRLRSKFDVQQKCVDLGRRDAEACARVYDKGLEQGWCIPNWWERIETEWKGEKALTVASALVHAREDWASELVSRIVGAFDFREQNGRSELKRRPRVLWWAALLAGLHPVPTPPTDRDPELQRWVGGLRHSYGAVLVAMKEASGWSWEKLMDCFMAGLEANDASLVVPQFVKQYCR